MKKIRSALRWHLRDGRMARWLARGREARIVSRWRAEGSPIPPPAEYKQQFIRDTARARGLCILVETGTNFGNTVSASLWSFSKIYSIELSNELYNHAVERFSRSSKVVLLHGDSADQLSVVLEKLDAPAIFWLDAHFSGEGTARAAQDTPILQELRLITSHIVQGHVILIDDARLFQGSGDYPVLGEVGRVVAEQWGDHDFGVFADVVVISQRRSR